MSESKAKEAKAANLPLDRVKELHTLAFQSSRTTVSVIDAMTQRGAVKGEELSAIGQLRDKCVALAKVCEELSSQLEK